MLREALAAALAGHGGVVLIGGEAGIGKTALAEAICHEAGEQDTFVLVGRCYALAGTPPYGPWAELFGRAARAGLLVTSPIAADRGGGPGPVGQQVLFARAREALSALSRPLVILLEDLHWADPGSLDLLRFIGRDLDTLPLLLLATYRADEVVRRHPLYALLPALVREARALRIDLHPLDAAGLRALVATRYALTDANASRLVDYLAARAEGNPFFAGELLRTLEEEGVLRPAGQGWSLADLAGPGVPALLRQVIDARIDRLGEEARGLLAVAAVLGQEVPLDLWIAVAGANEEVLLDLVERAIESRVLVATAEGARFAHALVREALYEGMLPLRRRMLHRRIADALLALPAPDADAVAYHLQQAGDSRTPAWLVRAGERAWRSYAWLSAAARYEAAVALTDHGGMDTGERARLRLMLAQLWRYEDRHRGIGYLEEAEWLALAAGDTTLAAAARFDRGHLGLLGDDARANRERVANLAAMAEALPVLEAVAPADRARLPGPLLQGVSGKELYHRGALMYWLVWSGRLAEAVALAEPMIARGPGTTARGLAALGMAYFHRGQPDEAERALADAQVSFRAAGQQVEVYYRLADRLKVACVYHFDEPAHWQFLRAEVDESIRRAVGTGQMSRVIPLQEFLLAQGDWAELQRTAADVSYWGWSLATIARAQGNAAVARAALERYLPQGPMTEPGSNALVSTLPFQQLAVALALDAGDLPTAHAWLGAHDRWLAWSGSSWGRAEGELGWAAYHRAAGDPAAALAHAERALAHATAPRQPLALLATHRLRGELATAEARYPEAATALDAALAIAEACAAPFERALTLLSLAELRLAMGDRAGARATLDQARAHLIPLGAKPALARADAFAASLPDLPTAPGGSPEAPSPPVVPGLAGLTAREVEVLRLVAAGQSNREMATALVRSERTIERHLENIYRKIGARNRADATAFALRHHLA